MAMALRNMLRQNGTGAAKRKVPLTAYLNPVGELGRELRSASMPRMPGRPPAVDGTVTIPGGRRRRRSGIPSSKI
jgi:hypothetical protein